MNKFTKTQVIAVLNEAGISDPLKLRLHAVLEQRHPEIHQAFLEFLALPATEIQEIRVKSRKG